MKILRLRQDMLLSFTSGSAFKGVFFQWDGESVAESRQRSGCSRKQLDSGDVRW